MLKPGVRKLLGLFVGDPMPLLVHVPFAASWAPFLPLWTLELLFGALAVGFNATALLFGVPSLICRVRGLPFWHLGAPCRRPGVLFNIPRVILAPGGCLYCNFVYSYVPVGTKLGRT